MRDAVAAIEAALPAGARVTIDRFSAPSGDGFTGVASVFSDPESVRALASRLPVAWSFAFDDRVLVIHVPWPVAPPIVASSYLGLTLHVLDPVTLAVVDTSDVLPGAPDDFALSFAGTAYVATLDPPTANPGLLCGVSPPGGSLTTTVAIPGLTSGVAVDPLDRAVYTVVADGTFVARDPDDLTVLWAMPGLGASTSHFDVALRHDGAFAYVSTAAGLVSEIDLLRRRIPRSFTAPVGGVPVVSDGGQRLAIVPPGADPVAVINLSTGLFLAPIAGPPSCVHGAFAPASLDLLVASLTGSTIMQAPGAVGPPVFSSAGQPGLRSLAVYTPLPGQPPVVLGACSLANQLVRGTMPSAAVPIVWNAVAGPVAPNAVRVPGR